MIPYGHQHIEQADIDEVVKVLASDRITQGPKVQEFENALAQFCGARYAVAVNSGTSALHAAYLAAGLGAGDEVITSPNTFAATANMILAVGALPVFCDIRMDTYNIDESKIASLITKKTKAIAPVHFAGHPASLDIIHEIARKNNLLVIEDACQALGAKLNQKNIGGLSDMSVFSFHPVKTITTGEGGAVTTNNEDFYEKVILLRSHGIYKDEWGNNVMADFGYNYRITDLQAALGFSQLKKIHWFLQQRKRKAELYRTLLQNLEDIILPQEKEEVFSAWHIYVIRTKDSQSRNALKQYLHESGIETSLHHPCVYKHPYYQKKGFQHSACPNAEGYEQTAITLPLYVDLEDEEIEYIVTKIKVFFRR